MEKIIEFEIIDLNEKYNMWFFTGYNKKILKKGFIMEIETDNSYDYVSLTDDDTRIDYINDEDYNILYLNLKDINKMLVIPKKDIEILKNFLDEINWRYKEINNGD